MVLLGLYLIAVFDCADQCQASTQQNHRKLLDTVYRLDRAPAPLLRVRQGGMAPRTMPKVLHVTSRWRSSIILHEGPDSTIGNINFIQSFHALGEMTENFVNVQWGFEGFARNRVVASKRFYIFRLMCILSALLFESDPLPSLSGLQLCEFVHNLRTSAPRSARVSCLRRCNEAMRHAHTYIRE